MRYDSGVTKSRPDYLVLNVLPGCVPIWACTATHGPPKEVPTEGGVGQQPPASNYVLPAGISEGPPVSVAETLAMDDGGRLVSRFL
jgi:hypothetical protein